MYINMWRALRLLSWQHIQTKYLKLKLMKQAKTHQDEKETHKKLFYLYMYVGEAFGFALVHTALNIDTQQTVRTSLRVYKMNMHAQAYTKKKRDRAKRSTVRISDPCRSVQHIQIHTVWRCVLYLFRFLYCSLSVFFFLFCSVSFSVGIRAASTTTHRGHIFE